MRILLLSRRRWLYTVRRIRETATRRSHDVAVVDPLECALVLGPGAPQIFVDGRALRPPDVGLPRIGASLPGQGVAAVSQLESIGVPVVNRAEAIRRARDKLLALQILAARGISVPRTVLARRPAQFDEAIDRVGGPPVVLKLLQGAQGVGVVLAETRAAAASILDSFWGLHQDVIVQEYVSESAGRDMRALVVGGRIVAAMWRQARIGEWRSNIHRGGAGTRVEPEPVYAAAALAAADAIGLDVAGVDLLEGRDGPLVIEVNASPGFEGLEQVCGVDAAAAIVDRAEWTAGVEPVAGASRLSTVPLVQETRSR